jgi:hypothetical protein
MGQKANLKSLKTVAWRLFVIMLMPGRFIMICLVKTFKFLKRVGSDLNLF